MATQHDTRRATTALAALAVGAFVYVTSEVLPIGLLTVIADDLGRSRSEVGLLVTGYAAVVVLMSVPMTRATQRIPRRFLITTSLGLLGLGLVAAALAPNFEILLLSRLISALSQSLFWSVVTSTATGLFPPEVRGRAIARMGIGNALAPVLGVPAGTWLGQQAGWRTAMLVMAGLTLATAAVLGALLPSTARKDDAVTRGAMPDARRYGLLVLVTAVAVAGAMTTYTYVTPFLLDVSGFRPQSLGPLLAVIGVAGVVGTVAVGRFLDRSPRGALVAAVGVMTTGLAGLALLGTVQPAAVVLLALMGLAFSAFAAAVAHRTLLIAPGSTDLASAGSSSAFNVGIAAGSLLGGLLITHQGTESVALVGGALAAVALAGLLAEPRLVMRRTARCPAEPLVSGSAGSDQP
jgi:DHA1 family L-arabinose/isopropyl-beta-D-thiogalactopyranoside export protein-like MFS transporter/DHA1 family inner membrane transport protein